MGGEIGPQTGHLFDERGGNIGVFQLRREKDGFTPLEEFPVHQGHLKFIFKVGKGAQTAQNRIGTVIFKGVHQKTVDGIRGRQNRKRSPITRLSIFFGINAR